MVSSAFAVMANTEKALIKLNVGPILSCCHIVPMLLLRGLYNFGPLIPIRIRRPVSVIMFVTIGMWIAEAFPGIT